MKRGNLQLSDVGRETTHLQSPGLCGVLGYAEEPQVIAGTLEGGRRKQGVTVRVMQSDRALTRAGGTEGGLGSWGRMVSSLQRLGKALRFFLRDPRRNAHLVLSSVSPEKEAPDF